MGCSVFPGVALCFIQANVLFAEEGSGIRLIFTVPFDHHRMLWGPFNEAGVLGLARSLRLCGGSGAAAGPRGVAVLPLPVQPFHLRILAGRGCCWSKAVSGSITPTSGGGRSSASGCSGSSPSASFFAADAHRGRAPLEAGRLRRRAGVAHRQRRLLLSHAFAGCKL